ncbi:dTDP-glucose 4,6-dehydratase [Wukongibacter sp. M2B1]|uniref:dTDP-glucose 4,6-dehydratase n=1 Tax=Wukongibacter sp. M2B1 TaxID=3088895 RepID=UPI003D7AC82B
MKVYLITGGAGFIGSNFIKYLLSKGENTRIINVDKLTYAGSLDNISFARNMGNHIFIKEDICNKREIDKIMNNFKPDYIVNFAAESHVDRSIEDSEDFVKTNVLGTGILLQSALKYGIKKFVQISTDEVYGSINKGLFTEESPLKPNNPYSASKASADLLVQSFYNTYKLPINITRCTNNYGLNQHFEKLIPTVIKHCLEGKNIPVYGDGKNIRDWIYVCDHCSAIYTVVQKGLIGEVYNISADMEMQNIEIIRFIIKEIYKLLSQSDERKKYINENLIQYVEDRKGHDRRYAIDASKIKNTLNWSAVQNLEEGLRKTIRSYL